MYVYRCPECPTVVRLSEEPVAAPWHDHIGRNEQIQMVRVQDTAKVLLPLDAEPGKIYMIPMDVEKLHGAGFLLPETQNALEWMYRHRERNGMAAAFCKVGGRRCIDLVAFARLMREQRA